MKEGTKPKETTPPRRSIRLRTVFDLNRLLARTINQVLRDEISEGKAGKIGYLSNVMLKSFEMTELEQRIQKLEEQTKGGRIGQ